MVGRSVGWSVVWLVDRLVGRLIGRLMSVLFLLLFVSAATVNVSRHCCSCCFSDRYDRVDLPAVPFVVIIDHYICCSSSYYFLPLDLFLLFLIFLRILSVRMCVFAPWSAASVMGTCVQHAFQQSADRSDRSLGWKQISTVVTPCTTAFAVCQGPNVCPHYTHHTPAMIQPLTKPNAQLNSLKCLFSAALSVQLEFCHPHCQQQLLQPTIQIIVQFMLRLQFSNAAQLIQTEPKSTRFNSSQVGLSRIVSSQLKARER